MTIFDSFNINASGLALERLKLDTISTNIANVNTTRTAEGGPYRKKTVVFEESLKTSQDQLTTMGAQKSFGVKVVGLEDDQTSNNWSYNPTHPDADVDGYVEGSNVNLSDEMIDMMNTVRTYEANVSAFESSKSMMKKALEITKD
ncbi:flagellar basal body rod protein FlgC [Vagococcus sp. BWB3-3]|uniref:Flagellar basal-body rod protein FlgC n=1 Tax=Vagococcus allomyrinae TaxID=2794353 RepID=A0A940PEI9_9ENTE|nr:flagellar basal body rod protein FlgC [Vagococcus allomyrinae]MBP1042051.1 flagellar basal body rod protein FlgC [Vagococcus allomyrinae]